MEVNLKMAHKSQLRALLSYCHELSHKKGGGVASNAPARTLAEFKMFRTTSHDPAQPIDPWWKMVAKSEGPANWKKSVKPNACDFKPFREMNKWTKCKESFMITLEAQNLALVIK